MTMPQNPSEPQHSSYFTRSPHVVGIASLILLGFLGFVFALVYLSGRVAPQPAASIEHMPDPFADLSIEAKSAIVVDLVTGKVLYAKNPDQQLPLASLTKVALALVTIENLSPDTIITIPYDTAPAAGGQRLRKGEKWKVADVLSFTLSVSSNEGANILASAIEDRVRAQYPQATPGSAAIWRMNDLVHSLGLNDMYFLNDNGLDLDVAGGKSGAYGTAREVSKLFAYAASTSPSTFAGTTKDGLLLSDENGNTASAINTNEALGKIPGLIMGKTGFTDLAGGNLAVVFDVGLAHPVVAVVMGSSHEGRFSDMKKIVPLARKAVTQE